MKPHCGDSCRFKCNQKIDEESRLENFKQFWKLGDHTRQWDFVLKHIVLNPPKKHKVDSSRPTLICRKYFLRCKGRSVVVCQRMFLRTLKISEKWVRTAIKKLGNTATISPDKRGRNTKANLKVSADVKVTVRRHIELFPRVELHLARERSSREYLLGENLNIRAMYRLYLEWIAETGQDTKATERQYREIFINEYNIAFHQPKKDQCELCTTFESCSEERRVAMESLHRDHLTNKVTARELKDRDKKDACSNPTVCFACFDLQKVLLIPKSEISTLYYKRKLSVFNFTIYDGGKHEAFCYVWNETEAIRGSNEVASCLLQFIETQVNENNVKDFRFFSDNCAGQNKNKQLFAMYVHACCKLNVSITQRYLEKGHTQNEGDSVHANIERAAKGKTVFVREEWYEIIRSTKKTGKPYRVVNLTSVFDFRHLSKLLHWASDVNKKKVPWSKVREVKVGESEGLVSVRTDLTSDEYITIATKRTGSRGRPLNIGAHRLKAAYSAALQIPKEKHADLMSLCNSGAIPERYHAFYQGINSADSEDATVTGGDDGYLSENASEHFNDSDQEL